MGNVSRSLLPLGTEGDKATAYKTGSAPNKGAKQKMNKTEENFNLQNAKNGMMATIKEVADAIPVATVILNQLDLISRGWLTPEEVTGKLMFVKYLVLTFSDTKNRINAAAIWQRFVTAYPEFKS